MQESLFDVETYRRQVEEAAAYIRERTQLRPRLGIILGTGLGELAREIEAETTLSYDNIPHFPLSTVESHRGRLIVGHLSGVPVYALQGRFHLYEGYTPRQVTFPVRVLATLGIDTLFISNAAGGMNPQMFNSFLDGTKSGIEMAAVANATGLAVPSAGLAFPACGVDDLPFVLRPWQEGGALETPGQVEVISSLERDGRPVFRDLRWGVYVVFEAPNPYTARCFREYGLVTDPSGTRAAMYKPYHLIGLELGISVLSAALRREATGAPTGFRGDVVATAKRDLTAGEELDGEGGFCVWGKLMPAENSLAIGGLPIGLAHGIKLRRNVQAGQALTWADVDIDEGDETYRTRRAMEVAFSPAKVEA